MNTTAPYRKSLRGKNLLSLLMVPRAGVLHAENLFARDDAVS